MPRLSAGRRYAEAAFELAERDGTVDAWRKDLATACELAQDERIVRAVDSPAVAFVHRRKAVEALLGHRVSRTALNLALVLAQRGRFALLPQISAEFDELVRRSRGIVAATVTTAAPLSAKELAAVQARVEQLAGAKAEVSTAIDPALIGGLCIKIGDWQIDASVSTRMDRLRKQLLGGTS
ncbi:MAG: ATP synthase F1 subunit delta [Candidatus Limnocylindrales bacterium]